MISLLLPYWDRQEAADKALALLAHHYSGLDLEVIVVDDGNAVPFQKPDVALDIRVITLPRKDLPKSPVTCWNVAAKEARGEILCLSCIEVLHETPVIPALMERLADPKSYVLAAAWCPELGWQCHSSVKLPLVPVGTGLAFCAVLRKDLYFAAGGFDEDYRDGAGYEDKDFINRLLKAGAKFDIRDDLVVVHPKAGATIHWPAGSFDRNQAIFQAKWSTPVTFVCVKAGRLYGADYVNILRDMVARNLPEGYPGRFVCFTDDPEGLDPGIEVRDLPTDLERWWGKLYLFKKGLFPDGERIVFFDLDTAIVGKLDDLVKYAGDFATLRDFYRPEGLGPAVILWKAGAASHYWDKWDAAGRPRNYHGDQGWLESMPYEGEILQDLFPSHFCSFKRDCHPLPPKGARVVCFHGEPRPHNANAEWVKQVWRIGGGTASELEVVCNTHRARISNNVRQSLARGIPELSANQQAVIVGGGPSLTKTLDEIRWRKSKGQTIFALNGAGKFLLENGIKPNHLVILDARPENVKFIIPGHCFLASHCDPSLFDAAEDATIYHVNTDGVAEGIGSRQADLISTGSTVGLVAIGIAHVLGYRAFHLFGMDSSYTDYHHAYEQPLNDQDAVIDAMVSGRKFKCAPWMVAQVQQFQTLAAQLAEEGCVITVAGDGLLPHVAREMGKFQEAA